MGRGTIPRGVPQGQTHYTEHSVSRQIDSVKNVPDFFSIFEIRQQSQRYCRSQTKVKFSTDQVRPALGSDS